MPRYRNVLPQLSGDVFLTDGGIETTLIFHEGLELPDFAAFDLLKNEAGTAALRKYFSTYNCAHPTHFADVLTTGEVWLSRIRGLRANASTKSHAELDEAQELDDGNPAELGQQYRALRQHLPNLNVLGGCYGTDHRHIEAMCQAWGS